MPFTCSTRSYRRFLLLLMLSYGFSLAGASLYFDDGSHSGALGYFAALVPPFPIVCVFVLIARYVSGLEDECLKVLEVRKALVATGFALSLATAWGFLEAFGQVPHLDSYWAAVAWFGGLVVGGCVNALFPPGGRDVEA